jgi:hypothetical protein
VTDTERTWTLTRAQLGEALAETMADGILPLAVNPDDLAGAILSQLTPDERTACTPQTCMFATVYQDVQRVLDEVLGPDDEEVEGGIEAEVYRALVKIRAEGVADGRERAEHDRSLLLPAGTPDQEGETT